MYSLARALFSTLFKYLGGNINKSWDEQTLFVNYLAISYTSLTFTLKSYYFANRDSLSNFLLNNFTNSIQKYSQSTDFDFCCEIQINLDKRICTIWEQWCSWRNNCEIILLICKSRMIWNTPSFFLWTISAAFSRWELD